MVLDTSAIVAVIRGEPRTERLIEAIEQASEIGIGAPTLVEASIVLTRRMGLTGRLALAGFLDDNRVVSIPFEEPHWHTAAQAFIRYGKGRHPAALNYGDCMTYATARIAEHPLLFVGDDFAKTDIPAAIG